MVYNLIDRMTPDTVPQTWGAFWAEMDDILEMVRADFDKDVQTYEEAIADPPVRRDVKVPAPDGSVRTVRGVLAYRQRDHLVRYRKTDDHGQLADFHRFGLDALQRIEDLVEAREWTPAFAHHWTVLMFAHGFIMSSVFATDDDVSRERGGSKVRAKLTRQPYQRWFAHYCLRALDECGDRSDADTQVERLVQRILAGKERALGGFPREWFIPMVAAQRGDTPDTWKSEDDVPPLTGRFHQKHLSVKVMRKLVLQPSHDIPPTNLPFPRP